MDKELEELKRRFLLSADRIREWSKTLPDEHRATLAKVCRTLPIAYCFCDCHISVMGD